MYFSKRRTLYFTIASLLVIPMFVGFLIPEANAAWYIGDEATSTYPARPGPIPVLDGVKESAWDSTSTYIEKAISPQLEFHLKYNGTMAYCVIIVKTATHTANESVLLILSNNGTKVTNPTYPDAKYIDINNVTNDRYLVADEYPRVGNPLADDQNITGCVRFSSNNYTVYEFSFKYSNTDAERDCVWKIGLTYLAKIWVVDSVSESSYTITVKSPYFAIDMGLSSGTTEKTIFDYLLDTSNIIWIAFGVIIPLFAIMGVFIVLSRKRLIASIGYTPDAMKRKSKISDKEIIEKASKLGKESLWEEEEEEGEDLEDEGEGDVMDEDDEEEGTEEKQ